MRQFFLQVLFVAAAAAAIIVACGPDQGYTGKIKKYPEDYRKEAYYEGYAAGIKEGKSVSDFDREWLWLARVCLIQDSAKRRNVREAIFLIDKILNR